MDKILSTFQTLALDWNKSDFGNFFLKKKRLLAWILGIQKSPNYGHSHSFLNLEKCLAAKLGSALIQEKEIWALKSRLDWLI